MDSNTSITIVNTIMFMVTERGVVVSCILKCVLNGTSNKRIIFFVVDVEINIENNSNNEEKVTCTFSKIPKEVRALIELFNTKI